MKVKTSLESYLCKETKVNSKLSNPLIAEQLMRIIHLTTAINYNLSKSGVKLLVLILRTDLRFEFVRSDRPISVICEFS